MIYPLDSCIRQLKLALKIYILIKGYGDIKTKAGTPAKLQFLFVIKTDIYCFMKVYVFKAIVNGYRWQILQ